MIDRLYGRSAGAPDQPKKQKIGTFKKNVRKSELPSPALSKDTVEVDTEKAERVVGECNELLNCAIYNLFSMKKDAIEELLEEKSGYVEKARKLREPDEEDGDEMGAAEIDPRKAHKEEPPLLIQNDSVTTIWDGPSNSNNSNGAKFRVPPRRNQPAAQEEMGDRIPTASTARVPTPTNHIKDEERDLSPEKDEELAEEESNIKQEKEENTAEDLERIKKLFKVLKLDDSKEQTQNAHSARTQHRQTEPEDEDDEDIFQ